MTASARFLEELTAMMATAHTINAVRKLSDSLAIDHEKTGGMKKNVTRIEEKMTATKPAIIPPNHALPMIAPKKRKTKG